jgi:hypothetical protein
MLERQRSVIQTKCGQSKKMSPYFTETTKTDKNTGLNEDLYDRLEVLNDMGVDQLTNETNIQGVPDGAFLITKADESGLDYRVQINDNRLPMYHRTNGITKMNLYNNASDSYSTLVNVINGMLWATDLMNKAYFKQFFPNVEIISGVQLMPYKQDDGSDNIQRIINLVGSIFYPMAISLLMPLFMYSIVLEKESKLVEIMKINGMKMRFYWLSNFTFNYGLYAVTMLIFNLIGGVALRLSLFTDTNPGLLFIIYLGWGLCQVGMAFFFQAFLSNARSATSNFFL